ncbi:hypothetical protein COV93_05255 [Candidatus Woesearchaeota archaeon CG11_big_fil_rev_8_21_14_0_20_43_8]|nr:MAG: hypothetical protein COV93_05255 [Candidatus Woesearchaeota archaeon CG11_big_fil_rev_8_21_14_0_20_43_8]
MSHLKECKNIDFFDTIPAPMLLINLDIVITKVNRQFVITYGYKRTELIGENLTKIIFRDGQKIKTHHQNRHHSKSVNKKYECRLKHKDDSIKDAMIHTSLSHDKQHSILLVEDITKNEKTKKNLDIRQNLIKKTFELTNAKRRSDSLLMTKTWFENYLSYGFRRNLLPLMNLLPLIKTQVRDKIVREHLDICIENTKELTNRVRSLLELSRFELGKISFLKEKTDIIPIIRSIAMAHNETAKAKLCVLVSNRCKQSQVAINKPRIIEGINYAIHTLESISKKQIVVRIEQNHRDIVLFFSTESSLTIGMTHYTIFPCPKYKGKIETDSKLMQNYIGLTICQKIIEMHGGNLSVNCNSINCPQSIMITLPKEMD